MLGLIGLTACVVHAAERPNILLIVADDLGYSDLGCYGGEMDTPCLDKLATDGVRFSEFHVNPMCVVTRTSLMTGHTHSQSDEYKRSLPFPKLLQKAGYSTSISGKWHQPDNPLDAGFDTFYGFLQGQIESWTGWQREVPTIQTDRQKPGEVADDWYSTDAFTDHAMAQIDKAQEEGKPFFTFVAYNAPHSPLQAPRENVEKYYGRFREGWDVLRQKRFERLLKMGMIDERYVMKPAGGEVRRWDEMTPKFQALESRRVAAYAGMVDRLDWNVGRLLEHVRKKGLDENTLVIFMSDNGGDYSNGDIETDHLAVPWEKEGVTPYGSSGWAYLKCTPFRWYKSCAQEGGVSVPLIVRWPGKLASKPGSILKQRLHVSDLYPTFLELAGMDYPKSDGERSLEPLYGHSILPLFKDPSLDDYAIHDEIFWAFNYTGKGLLKGDWKITSISDGPWQLYNMAADPAESTDLAAAMPEKLKAMNDEWFDFAKNKTAMPADWRRPLSKQQEGWGFHRVKMVIPSYQFAQPNCSALNVPCKTNLSFTFSKPISFEHSKERTIRLYSVAEPHQLVWQADPEPGHPAEGEKTIVFTDLPELKPNTTYFVLSDYRWITLGGKPAGAFNDGAFWYRFRTGNQ